jgi:hypothetical protein
MGPTVSPSSSPSASAPTPRPGYTPEAQKLLKFRWAPKTRLQVEALNSAADILGMGGAAGSLKTFTLLADAVQEFRNSNLRAILFRESFPNLRDVILKSFKIYKRYPYYGDYNKAEHVWRFPTNARELADPRNIERVASGELKPIYVDGACATIEFKYLSNYLDCEINHQGQEYSWIGFDEATHFTEDMIQYLLTRLRSVDPTLRLRMRLATNPGGIGHAWFMKLFVGEDCPHCDPQSKRCRKPFLLYKDAQWMDGQPLTQIIDGQEVIYTTQFIPGHLGDHEFFGKGNVKYKALLRMQRPATAKALEEGCWRAFEGQYFDVWEENRGISIDDLGNLVVPTPDMRMVVPRNEIEANTGGRITPAPTTASPFHRRRRCCACGRRPMNGSPTAGLTCSTSTWNRASWRKMRRRSCSIAGSSTRTARCRRPRAPSRCGRSRTMPSTKWA